MKNLKLLKNFHYSIKFEMIFIYIIISIIPILLLQMLFYNFSKYYLEQKINAMTNNNLSYLQNNINVDLAYYKDVLYRIDVDDQLIQNATNINMEDGFQKESCSIKLRDLLASYADIRDEFSGIAYINNEGYSVFYDKKSPSASNYLWDSYSEAEKKQIYNQIYNSKSVVILNTHRYYYNNEENFLYNIGLKAWNVKTGESLGIIVLWINEKHMQDICNINSGNVGSGSVKEYSFVVKTDGTILSFYDKKRIGSRITCLGNGRYDIHNLLPDIPLNQRDGIIVNSTPVDGADWSIINLVDKNSMFAETTKLWQISMLMTALIIAVCLFLIYLFSNRFYKSVNDIVLEIKKAKRGDFSAHIKLKGEKELIFISSEFNDMTQKINSLVENLKKQNDYIYEISNKRREAEINAIVSQINPHFLYNTLDCINWMAISSENYEISKMIGNLAQILRYSIRSVNEEVTIFEEVDWLKKYLYLHEVRFRNSFTYQFDVQEEILGCKIYKLLLQPIVENAIIHGFKGYDSGRVLSINIQKFQERYLHIVIEDNGSGIPAEKPPNGIGIQNVYERLQVYYKESAEMTIFSEENKGTKVTILIPLKY